MTWSITAPVEVTAAGRVGVPAGVLVGVDTDDDALDFRNHGVLLLGRRE
ncbi:MAG TPA: hypothetical protein VFN61_13450 [Acidimicrobiales bacterium]|nr:hypothetical protein [Acidimicrobiales bacterium]